MKKTLLFFLGLCLVVRLNAASGELDWEPANRPPVRASINECLVFLCPAEPSVNDSVGIVFSKNNLEDFEAQWVTTLADRGRAAMVGSHLFVNGIRMGQEKKTVDAYYGILQRHGFARNDVRVRVLSIPREKIEWLTREVFAGVWERIVYFLPSLSRDYQAPIVQEIITGLVSDAAVEVSNINYLYQSLPFTDATLTVGLHATILGSYAVYKKFLINWLLRKGSGNIESFIKQVSLSLPFVANYSVFGNFSQIVGFYKAHGWAATSARFPHELANFTTTQGFTIFLQTLFYNVVITKGVRGWENGQVGTKNSTSARVVSNLITIPILSFDAVFLAMASANHHALYSVGPFDINSGHAFLAVLTTVGSALWAWPSVLNPAIHWYDGMCSVFSAFRQFVSRTIHGSVEAALDVPDEVEEGEARRD